mmetsp:Transcript_27218/g.60260  ORF Transcript_27218/g.60260 Transcript_27218/m.60260 type:complete len:230 (+) Transcript_27218:786-1475(+)
MVSLATFTLRDLKFTPTVEVRLGEKVSIVHRIIRELLPTPLSPSIKIFTRLVTGASLPAERLLLDRSSRRFRFSASAAIRSSSSSRFWLVLLSDWLASSRPFLSACTSRCCKGPPDLRAALSLFWPPLLPLFTLFPFPLPLFALPLPLPLPLSSLSGVWELASSTPAGTKPLTFRSFSCTLRLLVLPLVGVSSIRFTTMSPSLSGSSMSSSSSRHSLDRSSGSGIFPSS